MTRRPRVFPALDKSEQIRHIGDSEHPCFDAAHRAILALADLLSLQGGDRTCARNSTGRCEPASAAGRFSSLGWRLVEKEVCLNDAE